VVTATWRHRIAATVGSRSPSAPPLSRQRGPSVR
jgi:hypothetical protein